jgi:hypothetical protein
MPRLTLNITAQRCREIIGDADARYWAADYGCEWNQSKCVLTLLTPEGCGEHDVKPKRTTIRASDIVRALKRMAEGKATHANLEATAARQAGRVIAGGGDPDSYDVVLQVAVFDGIVYG